VPESTQGLGCPELQHTSAQRSPIPGEEMYNTMATIMILLQELVESSLEAYYVYIRLGGKIRGCLTSRTWDEPEMIAEVGSGL